MIEQSTTAAHLGEGGGGIHPLPFKSLIFMCPPSAVKLPVRAIFLEFTKNALKIRPLRALFFEFTKKCAVCGHFP